MRLKYAAILSLTWALAGSAHACFSPESQETIFYKAAPTQSAGNVVAKIVITRIVAEPTERYRSDLGVPVGTYVAEAHVLQVLNGEITEDNITIVARGTDCDDELRTHASGIVVGRFQKSSQGSSRLILVPHFIKDGN